MLTVTTNPLKLSERAENVLRWMERLATNPEVVADPRCNHSTTVTVNMLRAVVRDLKAKNL